MTTSSNEARRLGEYERWLGGSALSAIALRLLETRAGLFAINGPVFRLPENLKIEARMRVLDIGCGRGATLRLLDDRVNFDEAPVGLDFSETALRLARRDRGDEGRPLLARGSALALPFATGAFDLVLSSYLVKHLDEDEIRTFFIEVYRVLAPGGLALIWDFAPTGSSRLDGWNRWVVSRGVGEPRFRSTRALMALGELAGFEYVRAARLRPFLLPPIPRASVLVGKPPEGWRGR